MDKKTISLILKISKIVISIILVIATTISLLGATLIDVARDYLQSEEFHNQIETTNLGAVKFTVNEQKISVNDYAYIKVMEYLENKIPSLLKFGNFVMDKVITLDSINKAVKKEVYFLVDYFLNSSVEDAEYRIENNIPVSENEEFDLKNVDGLEGTISRYFRVFVLQGIENVSGMSTDKLIILVSEKTVTKCVVFAIIFLIALVVINRKTILNNLILGGAIGLLYGTVIFATQNMFNKINEGMEDLVGYVFLKPLADAYSTNAIIGIIVGVLLIALFIFVCGRLKKQSTENLPQEISQLQQ